MRPSRDGLPWLRCRLTGLRGSREGLLACSRESPRPASNHSRLAVRFARSWSYSACRSTGAAMPRCRSDLRHGRPNNIVRRPLSLRLPERLGADPLARPAGSFCYTTHSPDRTMLRSTRRHPGMSTRLSASVSSMGRNHPKRAVASLSRRRVRPAKNCRPIWARETRPADP